MVERHFDKTGEAPQWIQELAMGDLKGYVKTSRTTFFYEDSQTGIKLTGDPDQIFESSDGTSILIDYKTSKITATQDQMYPVYEFQLNGYRLIAESIGLPKVSKMALIYTEPQTDDFETESVDHRSGFIMDFKASVRPVEIKDGLVESKMAKAREIMELQEIPKTRKFFQKVRR